MPTENTFVEKQYLGRNSYGLSRRLVMIVFCFIAHFYSEEKLNPTGLFIVVGFIAATLSFLLLFVPLYTIKLEKDTLQLKSLRKVVVNIPVPAIQTASVVKYSRYHFNNPVFNVLDEKEYKFYAEGSKALLLNMEDGKILRIGAKEAERLLEEIEKMKTKK